MTITITFGGKHVVAGAAVIALGLGVLGCSQYNEARGIGDAPIGRHNDSPADVTNFPDKFGNVATKCSTVAGKRIWMATHGNNARTFTVESDASCGGTPG